MYRRLFWIVSGKRNTFQFYLENRKRMTYLETGVDVPDKDVLPIPTFLVSLGTKSHERCKIYNNINVSKGIAPVRAQTHGCSSKGRYAEVRIFFSRALYLTFAVKGGQYRKKSPLPPAFPPSSSGRPASNCLKALYGDSNVQNPMSRGALEPAQKINDHVCDI